MTEPKPKIEQTKKTLKQYISEPCIDSSIIIGGKEVSFSYKLLTRRDVGRYLEKDTFFDSGLVLKMIQEGEINSAIQMLEAHASPKADPEIAEALVSFGGKQMDRESVLALPALVANEIIAKVRKIMNQVFNEKKFLDSVSSDFAVKDQDVDAFLYGGPISCAVSAHGISMAMRTLKTGEVTDSNLEKEFEAAVMVEGVSPLDIPYVIYLNCLTVYREWFLPKLSEIFEETENF